MDLNYGGEFIKIMNSETINKIKNNINSKFASVFTKDELSANNFIPINKQAGFFFIAIKEGSNKSDIAKFVATKDSDTLKYVSLNEESFNALFDYYVSEYYSDEKENNENNANSNYVVEIVEYLEDYSNEDSVVVKTTKDEEIGRVAISDGETKIQEIVKNNKDRFEKKKIYLKIENENLIIEKVEV